MTRNPHALALAEGVAPERLGPKTPAEDPGPAGPPREEGRLDEHVISLLSPYSFEADQYRVLRRILHQAREATGLKVLAVSSPVAGDGKTTTAINLAATLGQTPGCRVLLVDTDLRRPSVSGQLGLAATGPGLAGAVGDESLDLEAVSRATPHGLTVLPAGASPADPCQVLESPRFAQLLEEARRRHDFVVLDTPPLLLVPDCRLISPRVDGFLLVIAAHRTPRLLLAEALDALEPAKVLGIVFNRDDRPLSRYYKDHYYSYYHRAPGESGRDGGWRFWARRARSLASASWK